MNRVETIELVAAIGEIWPAMKLTANTPKAWQPLLDDVDQADALHAVRTLAMSRTGYISPADIRRQIAATAGLLAPDEADALRQAAAVAGDHGTGASKLHPAVHAAYRALGGATGFDAPPEILRPQWGRAYRDATRRHEEQLLAGDLTAAIAAANRPAITAAAEQPALDPTVRDRSAAVRALITQTRDALPASSPDKLRPRSAWWRRENRRRSRPTESNPHFTGYPREAS
jgi:hypothetical protein